MFKNAPDEVGIDSLIIVLDSGEKYNVEIEEWKAEALNDSPDGRDECT